MENIFSKEQKLSVITLMRLIANGSQDSTKVAKQKEAIVQQANSMGLSVQECDKFLNELNPQLLNRSFADLSTMQKDYLVSMVYEILITGGQPSQRECLIAESAFEKIANMSASDFQARFTKLQNVSKHFWK